MICAISVKISPESVETCPVIKEKLVKKGIITLRPIFHNIVINCKNLTKYARSHDEKHSVKILSTSGNVGGVAFTKNGMKYNMCPLVPRQ